MQTWNATTILSVRKGSQVAVAGDGQVTLGETIAKADAVKVRKLEDVGAEAAGVLPPGWGRRGAGAPAERGPGGRGVNRSGRGVSRTARADPS